MQQTSKTYDQFMKEFSQSLYNITNQKPYSDILFVCIGSDRSTGDAFGPLVGNRLSEYVKKVGNMSNVTVFGDLEKPINSMNIKEELKKIESQYENPCIIVIDSALSKKENVGKIVIAEEKTYLGKGIGKKIIPFGDISIKGVVAKNLRTPQNNFLLLQNTSLNLVMKLAQITADGIFEVIKYA